jgi:hypothetical protein
MRSLKHITNCKCGTCRCRTWRKNNPVKYSYNNLKNRAKQRGKVFTISFEYFEKFCYKTNYIKGKGRTATSSTVDRKIEELGYIPGNLQKLPLNKNIRKRYLLYDWQTKTATVERHEKTLKEIMQYCHDEETLRKIQSLRTA